ncbi:MAG: hypothetical protein IKI37_01750 [Oscillospiraceae bacterium]|nr:hypothetical protein [Oscillospiraceae bacterium]
MDKKLHSYLETGLKNPAIWVDENGMKLLYCIECSAYIGSENDMDYYSMIKRKYCDKCKKIIHDRQVNECKKRARRNKKALNQKNDSLIQENKKLREINARLDGQVNALDGETLTDKIKSQEQEIQELRRMINALAKRKTASESKTKIFGNGIFKRSN